jgi:hypothetical protein
MNSPKPNALARVLRGFFADHLPRVRGSSPHTVLSYRDTLVLLTTSPNDGLNPRVRERAEHPGVLP